MKGRLEADLTNMKSTSQKVDETAFYNNISDSEKVKILPVVNYTSYKYNLSCSSSSLWKILETDC